MTESRVKIELLQPGRARILINGHEIPHVRELRIKASVDEINTVTLTLIPDVIEVTGLASVAHEHAILHPPTDDTDVPNGRG